MTVRRKFDSSITRVRPVLRALEARSDSWPSELLELAGSSLPTEVSWRGIDMRPTKVDFADALRGRRERAFQPPKELLRWLVRNVTNTSGHKLSRDPATAQRRQRLMERDPAAVANAISALSDGSRQGAWSRFEGPTYPDAVIETSDALIIVEGKRTERRPTTHTTWMPGRHQMLRHLDGAWEVRGKRHLFGMFIVEADSASHPTELPPRWVKAVQDTTSPQAINSSLPHRSAATRAEISRAFVGATTWQAVCRKFNIILPDEQLGATSRSQPWDEAVERMASMYADGRNGMGMEYAGGAVTARHLRKWFTPMRPETELIFGTNRPSASDLGDFGRAVTARMKEGGTDLPSSTDSPPE